MARGGAGGGNQGGVGHHLAAGERQPTNADGHGSGKMRYHAFMQRITANAPVRFVVALLWMPFGALGGVIAALLITIGVADPLAFLENIRTSLMYLLIFMMGATPFLMIVAPLLGVPAHLLLLTLGSRRWSAYVALGLAVGAVFAPLPALLLGLSTMPNALLNAMVGGAGGFGGALAFWTVLRPDRLATLR